MVLGEVKRTFNPEFVNRVDEIIVFEALTDEDLRAIMRMLVTQLNDNLVDRDLRIDLTSEVIDWIIDTTCKDRSYGVLSSLLADAPRRLASKGAFLVVAQKQAPVPKLAPRARLAWEDGRYRVWKVR